MPNPNSALIIKYAFSKEYLNICFTEQVEECEDRQNFPNPYTNPEWYMDDYIVHFLGMGHLGDLKAHWIDIIAYDLNISIKEVENVLQNRLYLKKLYNKLNIMEIDWKIRRNKELLNAIRKRVTERRIALSKIKRNALYNNGLGLKLAVREYSKDF